MWERDEALETDDPHPHLTTEGTGALKGGGGYVEGGGRVWCGGGVER